MKINNSENDFKYIAMYYGIKYGEDIEFSRLLILFGRYVIFNEGLMTHTSFVYRHGLKYVLEHYVSLCADGPGWLK